MSNKYTKRHFEDIAKLLKELKDNPTKQDLIDQFVTLFMWDNPRFKRAKFLKACGV